MLQFINKACVFLDIIACFLIEFCRFYVVCKNLIIIISNFFNYNIAVFNLYTLLYDDLSDKNAGILYVLLNG